MSIAITILHVVVSIFMIAVVLLQSGKGAEMGASFGSSGSQSVFGAGGGTTFLSKMTTGAAVIFMLTSLTLSYISGNPASSSLMSSKSKPAVAVPSKQGSAVPVPGVPATKPSIPVAPAQPQK
jgi:preprotein translocase subunit SecG